MDSETLKTIGTIIIGSMIPVIVPYLSDKLQRKRDDKRFAHERLMESEKRRHEFTVGYRKELLTCIAEIHGLLNYFAHSYSTRWFWVGG